MLDHHTITIMNKEQDKYRRPQLEEVWIILMNTLGPIGLNEIW